MTQPIRKAFTTVDLIRLQNASPRKAPLIHRLLFSGKASQTILIPGHIKHAIPNRLRNLTVYIADPTQYEKDDKTFQYRIIELSQEWHNTPGNNFTFLNLQHGSYHLQVKSSTDDTVAEATFIIKRPWYLSILACFLYGAIMLGLVFTGIKIFRFELDRHRRLIEYEVGKNRLESELDHKSYELMLTMRYLIRKTDILKELHTQIEALKADSSKYPVKFIREMERIIKEGLDSQTEEWKNAMNNLRLSQEGFFRKLKEKYPNLTTNDLRLCSYLRMNFSTKEMAHLLNISGRAVEIGRYRLRRKLHIDHAINLTEFLIREAE